MSEFTVLADERIELKRQKDVIEVRIKELNDLLTPLVCEEATAKVDYGGYTFGIVTRTNEKLDREKLLLNGVAASVIAASITTSTSSFLDVREIKAKKGQSAG